MTYAMLCSALLTELTSYLTRTLTSLWELFAFLSLGVGEGWEVSFSIESVDL